MYIYLYSKIASTKMQPISNQKAKSGQARARHGHMQEKKTKPPMELEVCLCITGDSLEPGRFSGSPGRISLVS